VTYQPRKIASAEAPSRKRAPARRDPLLSIVVPVKNEEESVFAFVDRVGPILETICRNEGWEILFVDDGSTDATLAAIAAAHLADPRVGALSLSRNFGKEAALSAGLDHARGRAVVPMDVDMQDPPEVLAEMSRSGARASTWSWASVAAALPTRAPSAGARASITARTMR